MPIRQTTCTYKEINGCAIKADVFLPKIKRPPILIYIHGGALISGSRKYLSPHQTRLFLKAGLAVIAIDYRLAPETKLPAIVTDIQDALKWAKGEATRLFDLDPERLVVVGGSAGGYLSLLSGTFAEKPKAIVSWYGYGDILGDWYTTPSPFYCQTQPAIPKEEALASVGLKAISAGGEKRYQFYFYCRQQGIWPEAVSGYKLPEDEEKLRTFCPVGNIGEDYPPTLLLHGDEDTDVPCEQSLQMSQALTQKRIFNQLIIIQGGEHGFDQDIKNPQVKRALEAMLDFIREKVL